MISLRSPSTGLQLRPDGPDTIGDGRERWPVLDGIPYLRTGRDDLVRESVAALDAGDRTRALKLLLSDADDWWDGPAPAEPDLDRLLAERDRLSLREAMGLLAFGRVGDYFAHRWTDPTFLAGLALIDAHWAEPAAAFELACGIGHYLRELEAAGVRPIGADVVFAKLWLARHWVVGPDVDLVCFDAGSAWPVADFGADLCVCHDAFYFLEPKAEILRRLRGLLRPGGQLAIGHVHNRGAANLSAGAGMTADEVAAMFPDAAVFDDAELTRAAADGREPVARPLSELAGVEAFSLVEGAAGPARTASGPLCAPDASRPLRRNPLYRTADRAEAVVAWPSERYADEYGSLATYPLRTGLPERPEPGTVSPEQVRRREAVALPTRW